MVNAKVSQILESVLGKGKTTNKGNIAFNCPFCQSSKKKLEIQTNVDSNGETPWHCWTCNSAGKKITSLFKLLNVSRNIIAELYSILNLRIRYGVDTQKDDTQTSILELPK